MFTNPFARYQPASPDHNSSCQRHHDHCRCRRSDIHHPRAESHPRAIVHHCSSGPRHPERLFARCCRLEQHFVTVKLQRRCRTGQLRRSLRLLLHLRSLLPLWPVYMHSLQHAEHPAARDGCAGYLRQRPRLELRRSVRVRV